VYTVLVEGDDLNDPDRGLRCAASSTGTSCCRASSPTRGLFPAIDVLRSVSRVATDVASAQHVKDAAKVRELLAAHEQAADLIQIGAYVPGTDPKVDAARAAHPRIEALIRQALVEDVPRAAALQTLRGIAGSTP
jgi:flagellum-specific ATP synthase